MSKAEYSSILDSAFSEGTPFINFTEYYSYALIPKGGQWLEVTYDFEDHEIMEKHSLSPVDGFNHFCEEVEKAMSKELEIFYLNKWMEFKESLAGDEPAKLVALIKEITSNPTVYGPDLPIVFAAGDIATLKGKL